MLASASLTKSPRSERKIPGRWDGAAGYGQPCTARSKTDYGKRRIWGAASGQLKLVRALAISVSTLGLTIDTKKRYGARLGGIGYVAFNIANNVSALTMGSMTVALLVKGAMDTHLRTFIYIIYCILMFIWTALLWVVAPPGDGGMR